MGIGPIEIQGSISRTQDFASIRLNEDNKGAHLQVQITQSNQKETDEKVNTVKRGDDVSKDQKSFDAREKGSNEYHGDGGQARNEKTVTGDGKVIIKGMDSSFDIKI